MPASDGILQYIVSIGKQEDYISFFAKNVRNLITFIFAFTCQFAFLTLLNSISITQSSFIQFT